MTVWNLTICRHSDGGKLTFADRIRILLIERYGYPVVWACNCLSNTSFHHLY